MDTKFSVAVHVLVLVSESPDPMTSDQMSESVGTNASYVRKVLGLLKGAGLVDSRQGARGYRLLASPEQVSLADVYRAVEGEGGGLLDIHQNANDRCVVGRNIKPVLQGMFAEANEAFRQALASRTLADCIVAIEARMGQSDGRGNEETTTEGQA